MEFKGYFVLFALSVVFSTAQSSLESEIKTKYCGGDESCFPFAKRCLVAMKPSQEEFDRALLSFNKCVAEQQLQDIFNNFKLGLVGGQTSKVSNTDETSDIMKGIYIYHKFVSYLETNMDDPKYALGLRCCFGKDTKTIDVDGNINKNYIENKIKGKITNDPQVLNAFRASLDVCPLQVVDCDGETFRTCAVRKCIEDIRTSGPIIQNSRN